MREGMLGSPVLDMAAMMQEIGVALMTYTPSPVDPYVWQWNSNIRVALFPETRCFRCGGAFRNKAIWVCRQDESNAWRLAGQWIPQNRGTWRLNPPEHPNVNRQTGAICFGDSEDWDDPVGLLFLYPSNNGWGGNISFSDWMEKYCDHVCTGNMQPLVNPDGTCYLGHRRCPGGVPNGCEHEGWVCHTCETLETMRAERRF